MPSDDAYRHLSDAMGVLKDGPVVIATPEEVLTGHPVGPRSDAAVCIGCGRPLHETDIVFAYAYRGAESAEWAVSRLYCFGCSPETIRSPTLGTTEVLIGGRLGSITLPTSRAHRLCLTELKTRAFSPPMNGCSP